MYQLVKGKESKRQPDTVLKTRITNNKYYDRDPNISAYVKLRSKGICDLCGMMAPFVDKDGKPFLESHHIKWLSRGGPDETDNMAAVCPNCHRKLHELDLLEDVNILLKRVEEYKNAERRM